jgi:hypothetical protein
MTVSRVTSRMTSQPVPITYIICPACSRQFTVYGLHWVHFGSEAEPLFFNMSDVKFCPECGEKLENG